MAKKILPNKTVDTLGVVGETFGGPTGFYGALIQIAHQGQEPKCQEPAIRILRFTESKRDMLLAQRKLMHKLQGTGNILHHMRDSTTLVCKDLERQVDPNYVLPKTAKLKQDFLDFIRFVDEDFKENRKARKSGDQEGARKRQDAYVKKYNEKGWVKYMRRVHNIRDDIEVIPGMHAEAEIQTRELNRKDKEAAEEEKPAEAEPEEEALSEDEVEEEPPYPQNARKSGQKFAAVSFLVDDTEELEVLVYIHAFFNNEKTAKDYVIDELNDTLYPLPVDVVDMYEWIYPLRMKWNDSAMSTRVEGLEETSGDLLLQDNQQNRADAVTHNRKLKDEARRKKEMHGEVRQQLCERLCITDEQFTAIIDEETMGTDAIIAICKIEDEGLRMEKVQSLIDQLEAQK
jgi:hypothetical protein